MRRDGTRRERLSSYLPDVESTWIATGCNCAGLPSPPGRETNNAMGDIAGHIFRVGLDSVMSGTVERLSKAGYCTTNKDPSAIVSCIKVFVSRLLESAASQS